MQIWDNNINSQERFVYNEIQTMDCFFFGTYPILVRPPTMITWLHLRLGNISFQISRLSGKIKIVIQLDAPADLEVNYIFFLISLPTFWAIVNLFTG